MAHTGMRSAMVCMALAACVPEEGEPDGIDGIDDEVLATTEQEVSNNCTSLQIINPITVLSGYDLDGDGWAEQVLSPSGNRNTIIVWSPRNGCWRQYIIASWSSGPAIKELDGSPGWELLFYSNTYLTLIDDRIRQHGVLDFKGTWLALSPDYDTDGQPGTEIVMIGQPSGGAYPGHTQIFSARKWAAGQFGHAIYDTRFYKCQDDICSNRYVARYSGVYLGNFSNGGGLELILFWYPYSTHSNPVSQFNQWHPGRMVRIGQSLSQKVTWTGDYGPTGVGIGYPFTYTPSNFDRSGDGDLEARVSWSGDYYQAF